MSIKSKPEIQKADIESCRSVNRKVLLLTKVMPQKREPQYTGYLLVERHAIGTLGNELHLANIDNTRSSLRLDILPTDRPTARIEYTKTISNSK